MAFNYFATSTTVATALPLATETVVATLSGVEIGKFQGPVVLLGKVIFTTGVGATTAVASVRRGTLATDTLVVALPAVTTPASSTVVIPFLVIDNTGNLSIASYVVTVNAAGAAATMAYASLAALVP